MTGTWSAPTGGESELRAQLRWYAVHTLPQREAGAAAQLAAQGFDAFLPLRRKTVRHARQLRTVRSPLFPRYLFVALDLTRDRWRSVNGTFGVARLIMGGEHPAPVPRGVVEDLLALRDTQGLINFDATLVPGQRVKLLSGPFADLVGELHRVDDAGRVKILLDLMGGQVPVWSLASAVAPAA